MLTYTVVTILAIAGALCLALMATARRWRGVGRWSGHSQDDEREEARQSYVRQLTAREVLLRLLPAGFGELPSAVVARIGSEGPEWCEEIAVRAMTATSLEEMGF